MSEHTREIPASLMDLPRLERYFEEQAERGLLLSRISGFMSSGNAVFEDITGDTVHFCVRPFEKGDFQRLKEEFGDCGWTLACTRGSLAVFHARTAERPPAPACHQEGLREILLNRVCKEERRLLAAVQIFMMVIELPLFYIIFSRMFTGGGAEASMPGPGNPPVAAMVMAISYLILSLSFCLGQWVRHFQAARCLRAGENTPQQIPFWNKSAEMSLGLGGLGLSFFYYGWLFRDVSSSSLAVVFLLVCAANIAVNFVWHKNTGLRRWKFIPWLLSPVMVVLLFWCIRSVQ